MVCGETLLHWLELYNAMILEEMILEEIERELRLRGIFTPPATTHQGKLISKLVEIMREEKNEQ